MTDNEIVRSYNEAANKTKQIGVLADLTQRKVPDIVHLLEANGATLPENYKARSEKSEYMGRTAWTNEREARLLALKEKGLTWEQIAQEIGGTAKSVSMHYYKMRKPKHIPQSSDVTDRVTKPVKDTPCPVEDTPQKTSAFGFENLIAVLSNGEFDSVTFENAEVTVTVRRKAT
jgi:DNA-binding CsgD family transcriptional regulator